MIFLIVEDNPEMRRLIKAAVSRPGDSVHERGDGADALAAYGEHRPDWVLMDIKMPGLDGIAATGQIKEAFPDARIVVVSQYNDAESRQAARLAGAADYVLKDDLLALRRILGRA